MRCSMRCRAASRRRCCTARWPSCTVPTRRSARSWRTRCRACSCATRASTPPTWPTRTIRRCSDDPFARPRAAARAPESRPFPDPSMKDSLRQRFERLAMRLAELDANLADPSVTSDMARYRQLAREQSEASEVVHLYRRYQQRERDLAGARELLADPDMAALAHDEIASAEAELAQIDGQLQLTLLPRDVDDARNAFLEIRAGTGGEESALF